MEPFQPVESHVVSMPDANIDTDQIIPARFLQKPRRDGCDQWLFHDLRFSANGEKKPTFVLNECASHSSKILVAGDNFGCGSSRENAVWALYDYGFRVVIAPSFGEIFFNNSLKNGLLPVRLPWPDIERLLSINHPVRVDLATQKLSCGSLQLAFEVDQFARHCLLNGIDELGYTMSLLEEIANFEQRYEATLE